MCPRFNTPFSIPASLQEKLEDRLRERKLSLSDSEKLATSIRKLSNLFIRGFEPGQGFDYWKDPELRDAYLAYFSVLNFVRASSVFEEGRIHGFFRNTKKVFDLGCGAGAATLSFCFEIGGTEQVEITGVDRSPSALKEYHFFCDSIRPVNTVVADARKEFATFSGDTLFLSYTLNEWESWPVIPPHVERLVIIEPSTHQAGRKLLEWRQELLGGEEEWFAWAPCTHQFDCPLLTQSGKDWCHHRVRWIKPLWFEALEAFLPMHNETLTHSYLLLSRDPPPSHLAGLARVTGDSQEEKGKNRQLVCRGPAREFLSWLHRDRVDLRFQRGDLLKIQNFEQRGTELRIFSADDVVPVTFGEKS